ncbi:MAG: TraR/DksA family transcriptional regulator [Maricaulaceae bacterium]
MTEASFDIDDIRAKLTARREEFAALSEAAMENRKPVTLDQQSVGRLSRMDSLQVQAMDKAQEQARRKTLIRIEAALERLEQGDFGYCVTCDEPISSKRLSADLSAPLCINCAR